MNLEHLSLFCEVVELGNFSDVAKQRFCNASSVSRSIAQLEEALGITLFYRSTRKVQLTEAGRIYYQSLKKLLPQFELANQQARDVQHALHGTVRITLPNDFAETLVVPHIQSFYQRYPEIKLELILTDDCLDLEQERIDLAIRLGEVQQSHWVAKKLRKIGFVTCVSPNFANYKEVDSSSPMRLQEIPCINFLAKTKIPTWRFIAKQASKDSQTVNINQQVYVNSAVAAKQLCLQGLGVAVLPDWMVQNELSEGGLVSLFEDYQVVLEQEPSYAWLVYPTRHYVPTKTRKAIDFLVETFAKDGYTDKKG